MGSTLGHRAQSHTSRSVQRWTVLPYNSFTVKKGLHLAEGYPVLSESQFKAQIYVQSWSQHLPPRMAAGDLQSRKHHLPWDVPWLKAFKAATWNSAVTSLPRWGSPCWGSGASGSFAGHFAPLHFKSAGQTRTTGCCLFHLMETVVLLNSSTSPSKRWFS